jgi:thiol:disulfide interchange protein DsbA
MTARLALLLLLLLPAATFAARPAVPSGPAPVVGTDYVVIEDGKPYQPLDGKIEVLEVFGYWCHHCADFAPRIDAWKRKQAADVRVTYLPLPNGGSDPLARAFFATEAAGVLGKTHDAMFRAIHNEHTLPKNPTFDEIAAFHAQLGLDAARLKASMESAAIGAKLEPAYQYAIHSGLEGTPTVIVNGRYRVTGRTLDDILRITDHLVARERAAKRR